MIPDLDQLRRSIHNMEEAMFSCPEFGMMMFEGCPNGCPSCPGRNRLVLSADEAERTTR